MQGFLPWSFPSFQGFTSSQGFPPCKVFPSSEGLLPCRFFLLFLACSLLGCGSRNEGDTPKNPPSLLGDPQALSVPLPSPQVGPSFLAGARGNLRFPFVFPPSQRGPSEVGFYFILFYFCFPVIPSSCHGSPGSGAAPNKAPGASRAPGGGFAAAPRSVTDRE